MNRVVVLGGTGYIGTAVCRALHATHTVTSVSRHPVTNGLWDHVKVDLSDSTQIREVVADADILVFTAGYSRSDKQWRVTMHDCSEAAEARKINVDAVATASAALTKYGRSSATPPLFVFASSMAVHDGAPKGYAAHKRDAERALAAIAPQVHSVSLRLSTVYGISAGETTSTDLAAVGTGVIATWARAALQGEPVWLWSDATIRRDLVHIDDVAQAVALVVDNPTPRSYYDIGSGIGWSLRWLAEGVVETVFQTTGIRSKILMRQAPDHATTSDLRSVLADPTPFTNDTGWHPNHDDPRQDIENLVAYLAAQQHREVYSQGEASSP